MRLLNSSKNKKKQTKPQQFSGDLITIRQHLEDFGFQDPEQDPDSRVVEIWSELKNKNLDVTLSINHDFSDLGPHDSPFFKFGQSRSKSESKKVADFLRRFYVENEPIKRPSIGVYLTNPKDGKKYLYTGIGNHRARTHEKAQQVGYGSLGSVIIVGSNADHETRLRFLNLMATLSNIETNDQTQEETREDIVFQIKSAFDMECLLKPKIFKPMTEQQKIEWASQWLIDFKKMSQKSLKSERTRLVNMAFSSVICQAIPMPPESTHNDIWQRHFPNDSWDPECKLSKHRIEQKISNTNNTQIEWGLFSSWQKRRGTSTVSPKQWVICRVGNTKDATVTSIDSVKNGRRDYLKKIKSLNNNKRMYNAGFSIIEKIVFVKQIDGLEEEAHLWNHQKNCFNKV